MNLSELLVKPVLEMSPFLNRIRREREKLRQSGAKGKIVPEFAEHIQFLQDWARDVVAPLADWQNKDSTADDVYRAILEGMKSTVTDHGVSEEQFEKVKGRLDDIRREWQEWPEPYLESGVYAHRLGTFGFLTEKEHLASVLFWWITAGVVGSASRTEPPPSYGSVRWQFAPDRGGSATGEGPKRQWRQNDHGDWITKAHPAGRVRRMLDRESVELPDIDILAESVAEDVRDTWRLLAELEQQPEEKQQVEQPVKPIAKPEAALEQAKKQGGKLVADLTKVLDVLRKSSDWPKIKQDVVSKLKPYLT